MLENAGIAWPNPGMWYNAPPGWYSITSPSSKLKAGDPNTHDHSSTCRMHTDDSSQTCSAALMPPLASSQLFSSPPTLYNLGEQLGDPSWSPSPPMPDPFVDENKAQKQENESGYGSFKSDRSYSATFGDVHTDADNDVPQITIEGDFDELIEALIHDEDKTFNRVATRTPTPMPSPSISDKRSPSPNSRPLWLPNEQHRAVPVTTRDLPLLPGSRESSDASIALGQSQTLEPAEPAVFTVKQSPALIIRSKKEGFGWTRKSKAPALTNGSRSEDVRWRQDAPNVVGEAKRKWSANRSTSSLLRDISNLGPVHKASRIDSKGDLSSPHKTEMLTNGADRSPHGESEIVH